MSEEGLSPREATKKAMGQITAALIGITRHAGLGVPADGVLRRLGGQHLSPVLAGDGERDAVLGVPRALAHAGAVRHLPEAGRGRAQAREARPLRLVQPRLQGDDPRLRGLGRARSCAAPGASWCCFALHRRASSCSCSLRMPDSFLPTEDQGYLIANVQLPPGATPDAHAGGDAAGRGLLPQPARGRQDGQRARLQLLRQRPERGARLRAAQALGRARGRRSSRRRRSPGAPSARSPGVRDAFVFALVPPAIPELGTATGFAFRLAGPRRQRPRRAGRGAQPAARHGGAEQGARRGAPRRPGGRAAARRSTSTATAPARSASRSTTSTRCSRPRSARPTSTTSRTPAGCSASSSRPTRRIGWSPTT